MKTKQLPLAVCTALAVWTLAAGAGDAFNRDKLTRLDEAVEQAMREGRIMGAVLWVERAGESYHKAFGNRSLQPEVEAMTEDTLFDLASITKVLATASAAMWCLERGLLQLDDQVAMHLPEFTGEGREKITVKHLLLHTSGLPVNLNPRTHPFHNHEEAIAQLCRVAPLFAPGSGYSYSSAGSMVLAAVIERATGRKFAEFCARELYEPLRMPDTVFRPDAERLRRTAPSSAPQRGLVDDHVARQAGGEEGHASLFSTAADMARFARMMLQHGELDGVRVFQPETIHLMTSVQTPPDLRSPPAKKLPAQRGLGWDIHSPYRTPPHEYSVQRGRIFPVGSYGHSGWTGQMLWIDPFSRTFVIFLCNRYGPGAGNAGGSTRELHHRITTLAAEAVKGFDFKSPPTAP